MEEDQDKAMITDDQVLPCILTITLFTVICSIGLLSKLRVFYEEQSEEFNVSLSIPMPPRRVSDTNSQQDRPLSMIEDFVFSP